jgi:hypothetical protein
MQADAVRSARTMVREFPTSPLDPSPGGRGKASEAPLSLRERGWG